ncbi:MAG: hypothetical protein DME13_15760 [Candidatus Rokuibacteriota bacterium]|nr:MAG: hypothetical protein DME13_15760 [Candidatus Rokubacteria bacterium]
MARAAGDGAAPAALRLSRRHARSPRRCHGGAGDRPAPLARAAGRRRRPVRAGGRARIPRGVRHRRRHAAVAPALRASRRAGHDHADRAGRAPQPRRADALPRGCRARRRRPSLSRGRPMTPLTLEANLRAGDHVCAMYDTDAEWLRAAIPYFSEGLVRGEACVYVAPEKDTAQLEVALRAAGIDMDAALRRGALRFATAEATYLRDGHFDPDAIIALWQELIDAAEGNGYTNLRVAGCPTWVNEGVPGAERWAEYEAEVNEFFRGRRAIKLCQYDRRLFSPTLLLDVLGCHPFAVVRGAVHANPFAGMPSARADHDLTDALARERTARLAAEAACRKKDEFIAVFSHELRTPLSSAVLAASLIERLPASDTRVATARDVLRRQLDQARRLVDELLDMERIATGQATLTTSRVDLAQLARECVAALPVRDHEFHVDARPAWVIGDLARLEQIVGHLLAHVAKHTPAGGRITLSVFDDADDVVLRVDGPAASPRAGARSLGLSLARRLVELHGGRVQDTGDGPGHVVRLPAAPPV